MRAGEGQAIGEEQGDARAERPEDDRRLQADERLHLAPDPDVSHGAEHHEGDEEALDGDRQQDRQHDRGLQVRVQEERQQAQERALDGDGPDHRGDPPAAQREEVEHQDDDEEGVEQRSHDITGPAG